MRAANASSGKRKSSLSGSLKLSPTMLSSEDNNGDDKAISSNRSRASKRSVGKDDSEE